MMEIKNISILKPSITGEIQRDQKIFLNLPQSQC